MCFRAGITSSHLRVFNPQSGFTQNCSFGKTRIARVITASMDSTLGTAGVCTSNTPGPIWRV